MESGTKLDRGFTLWFTGLSGAGKTTVSEIVEKELRKRIGTVEVLDGDKPIEGPGLLASG